MVGYGRNDAGDGFLALGVENPNCVLLAPESIPYAR